MGLLEIYNAATTSAGRLKDVGNQASGTGAATGGTSTTYGVDFMDGSPRQSSTADQFQTEFKKYAVGANKSSGANHTVPTSYTPSRWTDKALKLAFENDGPASLPGGYYNTTRFRVAKAGQTTANIHNYIPAANYNASTTGGYINQFSFARDRKNARPNSL